MRGEHKLLIYQRVIWVGSSPHARGAHLVSLLGIVQRGIIPACAGSTRSNLTLTRSCWDHPRMRGEHRSKIILPMYVWGSSPHARRARAGNRVCELVPGIIPACAGSTQSVPRRSTISTGSSPHARGAHIKIDNRAARVGIIPACAGSTSDQIIVKGRAGDHPRMRGEHLRPPALPPSAQGSSPHARGARVRLVKEIDLARINPASAGSTCTVNRGKSRVKDHPRMRGEHELNQAINTHPRGSSPHARGAPQARQ